jgi:uncharacterized protein (UPF0261 family)
MTTVVLVGTLDTKGHEYARLRELVQAAGAECLLIDGGVLGESLVPVDIGADVVAEAAGSDLEALRSAADRGEAVRAMGDGLAVVVQRLHAQGRLDAIGALGGSGGTALATAAMRSLPFGVPKLMVSTLASGDVGAYVQGADITLTYPVVDVVGDNRILERVLRSAAGAIVGMAQAAIDPVPAATRPVVAATMFGVTTPCVTVAREQLESAGHEVLTFHATGVGGDAMERLIAAGYVDAVLDVTTTELADELVGGIHPSGAQRLRCAGAAGIPQVFSVGALDMVNFGPPDTVPAHLAQRAIVRHNPMVTLVRTSPDECAVLGARLAERARAGRGPVCVLLPLRGVSALSAPGGPFHDPVADAALFDAIRAGCGTDVEVIEHDCSINDPPFARALAERLVAALVATKVLGLPRSY